MSPSNYDINYSAKIMTETIHTLLFKITIILNLKRKISPIKNA